jgi:hypothetical protein
MLWRKITNIYIKRFRNQCENNRNHKKKDKEMKTNHMKKCSKILLMRRVKIKETHCLASTRLQKLDGSMLSTWFTARLVTASPPPTLTTNLC